MIKFLKAVLLISGILSFCFSTQPAFGKTQILTNVKVIHASTRTNYLDPGLKEIISELESVFKYTSYKLLQEQTLNLKFNQKESINLPGQRTMIVTALDRDNKRIRYQINILKNRRIVFQTRILLKNNSSITIGGPKFNNGYLLFNISGSM